MKPFIVLVLLLGCISVNARYTTFTDTLTTSEIYPGTAHYFTVTVPDKNTDSCALYVGLDGVLCRAPQVLDSLFTAGAIPPTVGIYLQAGVVLDKNGEIIRYNRSNEFDSTDPRFSTFLCEELLPYALRHVKCNISSNPSQRAIFGLSSGGIAAFTAAWHRPDMFGNVFTGCGTFVPMRGGNDLQAIVRKHEPKPIRVFLQDGYQDTWNPLFGSWYEANAMMASALDFAGYDCKFHWSDSGHSVYIANIIFPEVIEWLFTSQSKPVKTTNDLLQTLLIPGEDWVPTARPDIEVNTDAIYPDSTIKVCRQHYATNRLFQQIMTAEDKWAYDEPFYWLHSYDNSQLEIGGMKFDANGNLWVVTTAGLQICDQNGRVRGIITIPSVLSISDTAIEINQNNVILSDTKHTYIRKFNVLPPTKGVRPKNQGQG